MRVFATVAPIAIAGALAAQVEWYNLDKRSSHAIASDLSRRSLIVFGGSKGKSGNDDLLLGDTWVTDPSGDWTRVVGGDSPTPRLGHEIAYLATSGDAGATSVVLFGGVTKSGLSKETWIFDGTRWALNKNQIQPPPRSEHGMVFARKRQTVILFGGDGEAGSRDDTWEWDGTRWTDRKPATAPSARWGHAMAYDDSRHRVLVFGGNRLRDDTWSYDPDKNRWTAHAKSGAWPTPRVGAAMAWDDQQGQIVLFGGLDASNSKEDTWIWNWDRDGPGRPGWVNKSPATNNPPDRLDHAMTYDRVARKVVLVGGRNRHDTLRSDVWEWNGRAWTRRDPPPAGRFLFVLEYHAASRSAVLFGGRSTAIALGDTWCWSGGRWSRSAGTNATKRAAAAATYDSKRGRVLMFGGTSDGGTTGLGDTWSWDGQNWRQATQTLLAGRLSASMAYDAARDRAVLFGGRAGTSYFGETWEWDGRAWKQRAVTGPSARIEHGMAYDAVRARVVLFGGQDAGGKLLSDTWEWDGAKWVQRASLPAPRASFGGLAYDSGRGRVVLFGGESSTATKPSNETWEWDGTRWRQASPSVNPGPRRMGGVTYLAHEDAVMLFGGQDENRRLVAETWLYRPVHRASFRSVGNGCPGSAGIPLLAPLPAAGPWLGASYGLALTRLPATAPAAVLLGAEQQPPIALDALGMKGCTLYTLSFATWGVVASGGRATWSTPIPNVAAFLGVVFRNQALVLDRTANAFGATMTNGGDGKIGSRSIQ